MGTDCYLSELEDSSGAYVLSRKNLYSCELPGLVQLHQLHPQLQLPSHLTPPVMGRFHMQLTPSSHRVSCSLTDNLSVGQRGFTRNIC